MDDATLMLSKAANLFVASIREPSNNDLRIVVVEGKRQLTPTETELGLAYPVHPDPTSAAFEITWWRYIAYSVRNESFFAEEEGETPGHSPFGIRKSSAYLDYVLRATFAHHVEQLTHWHLYTEWHCVDVVAVDPPEIRQIPLPDVVWDLQDRPS